MKKQLLFVYILFFSFYLGHGQFFEGFENTTGPDLPGGPSPWTMSSGTWQVFDNGVGTGRWTINNTTTTPPNPPLVYSGSNAAYMNRVQTGSGNTSENYLATPAITVPLNAKLSFYSRTFTQGNQGTLYQIKVCPATSVATNPSNYTTIAEFNENEISAVFNLYERKIINLPANLVGTQVHIAFVRMNTQLDTAIGGDRWLLDDVGVYQGCMTPSTLNVSSVTQNSASLSWNQFGGANQFEIEVLPSAATPTGFGTTYSGTLPYVATTTSYGSPLLQIPLNPNTTYKFYVRAICTGNIPSEWTGPFNFATTTAPLGCGGNYVDAGGPNANYPNNSTATNGTTVICPSTPGELVTVNFTSFTTQADIDVLYIYNGNVANVNSLLGSFSGTTLPPSFTSSTADGCLTFVFVSNATVTAEGWVANITCSPPSTCLRPTGLFTTGISSNSTTFGWTNVGSASSWQCIVLPQGSPAPTANSTGWVTAQTNPFVFAGLNSATCYTAYVRSDCTSSLNGLSNWSAGVDFCTTAAPPICGGNFVDQGGVFANYPNNSNSTVTICPTVPGDEVAVTFTSFSTEATFDALYVYSGISAISSALMPSGNPGGNVPGGLPGGYWGNTIPGPFTGDFANGGCLTFVFRSDSGGNSTGWTANVTCGINSEVITLVAFVDTNNNGVKDTGETAFSNGSFVSQLNDSGINNYITSVNGNYNIPVTNLSDSYDFSYLINSELTTYFATSTSYSNISVVDGSGNTILYFPITILSPYNDVRISLQSNNPRAGFNYPVTIIYKNNGLTPATGSLTFVKPSNVTMVSISQTLTTPNATGFSYNYSNLNPNETRTIIVTMAVPPIPTVNLGDIVTSSATISAPGDVNLNNNSFSLSRIVVASYDPNDKSEAHGPQIQFNQFTVNDYLYYTVNFQNEGTADALTVRIEDLLNTQIDETSIRMVDASHAYTMQRTNSQIIWTFDDINLPPKSVNEPLSKGYVMFKVKLKPGFAVGDVIPNTAQIYFDTNPAIVTNTFNTQFVALNNLDFDSDNFILYPNPAKDHIVVAMQNSTENIQHIIITDVLGKMVKSIHEIDSNETTVAISDLAKGMYLIEITTESNLKIVKKLVIN